MQEELCDVEVNCRYKYMQTQEDKRHARIDFSFPLHIQGNYQPLQTQLYLP